ncbi:MAG: MATE family efflux transporter [Candidatus Omnitrophica bacterium]|nr:MATE family efflux transporter [Candidatus Omnitrophota bacterium]
MEQERARKINNNITNGTLKYSIWKLALPLMVGALLQNLFSLVDLFFVGRLGYIAVAALSIAGVIISVIMLAAIGISVGTTALVAHFIGKKDYDSADNTLFQTILVSFFCSLLMIVIGIFATEPLLRLFGAHPEVIPGAASYLKISFIWSISIFLFIGLNQALRGSGDAVIPLKVLVIANIINIGLDPLLIFGPGFFPRMEVAGSAAATVISRMIGVIILLRHVAFGNSSLHLNRKTFKINFPIIIRMIKIGFFASVEVFMRQISLLLLLRLVTSFGPACLAAYGIAIRLRMTVMMLGFGMGIASAVLIGQNMGAGNPKRATSAGFKTLKYYVIMVVPVAVLFFMYSHQIISVFNNNPEVVKLGSNLLRFIAVTLPFLATTIILGRGVNGAGDTIAPAIMTAIAQLGLRIPVAYMLVFIFKLGVDGIWLGINASDVCQALVMLWYFKSGFWQKRYQKHREILEQDPAISYNLKI